MSNFHTDNSNCCDTVTTNYLIPSNLIPHEWYKKFLDNRGHSDLKAINVLSDLLGSYRMLSNKDGKQYYDGDKNFPEIINGNLSISYNYLSQKLLYSKITLKRALVRLEKFGVLKREVHNIEISAGSRTNRLLIHINNDFFKSCFRDPESDIRVKIKPPIPVQKGWDQISTHHIISKKNIINRSGKSDFKKFSYFNSARNLKELYPLTEEENKTLQELSGRSFSLRAMNEILKDMGSRISDRLFKNRNAFLNYMGKVFTYEKRDADKINNETFVILPPEVRKQENYLQNVENSNDPFKRKLATGFDREKAYRILEAYKFSIKKGEKFILHFNKSIALTDKDKEKILEIAQYDVPTQRRGEKNVGQIFEEIMPMQEMNRLEIIMPEMKKIEKPILPTNKSNNGVWENIQTELVGYYGNGINSFIAYLNIEIDEKEQKMIIEAPNSFIFNYINENYKDKIESLLMEHNYKWQGWGEGQTDYINYKWTFYNK